MYLTEQTSLNHSSVAMNEYSFGNCPYKCCTNSHSSNFIEDYNYDENRTRFPYAYPNHQLKYNSKSLRYSNLKYPPDFIPNVVNLKYSLSNLNKDRYHFDELFSVKKEASKHNIESILNFSNKEKFPFNGTQSYNSSNSTIFKPYIKDEDTLIKEEPHDIQDEMNKDDKTSDSNDDLTDTKNGLQGLLNLAKVANEHLGKEIAKEKRRNKG